MIELQVQMNIIHDKVLCAQQLKVPVLSIIERHVVLRIPQS